MQEEEKLGEVHEPGDAKDVTLDGVPTVFIGAADDPYFQTLQDRAQELSGLAVFLRTNVADGATVIDVGANIGLSTILMARMVKTVFAFEASPKNAVFLQRNLELNGIENVRVHVNAVSHEAGSVRIHEADFGAGSHVVSNAHLAATELPTVNVDGLTLDSLDLPPIDFIKIDAEGHEPNVLAGARSLLRRDAPLVYTEVNAWCLSAFAGHSLGAFVRILWQCFDVNECAPDGSMSELTNAYVFLHELLVKRGGLSDIVIRPKAGAEMPDLPTLTWPEPALRNVR